MQDAEKGCGCVSLLRRLGPRVFPYDFRGCQRCRGPALPSRALAPAAVSALAADSQGCYGLGLNHWIQSE